MTTDDLAGLLREHQYVTPESEDEYGAHNYTCQCGELMHECYEDDAWAKLAAHQAAVIAAAGWVKPTPAWDPWLENDGEYEYSDAYDCDGTFLKRWKRKPRLSYEQDYTNWEEVPRET